MDENNRINHRTYPGTEIGDRQHLNPDGQTDAEKGMNLGGIGGAVTGAVAGSLAGPLGLVAGAVIGGVAGALAGGAAVAAIDKVDGDSATDHPREVEPDKDTLHWGNPRLGDPRLDAYQLPEHRFDHDVPVSPASRHDLAPLTPYYNYSREDDYPLPSEGPAEAVEDKTGTRVS